MTTKKIFISALILLVAIFITATVVYKSQSAPSLSKEAISALERENAPVKGGKNAKVTIVEFFDPACETCRRFYPLVNNILKIYQGRVKVVMRYAPFHQGSEDVVKMLEAAHLQGQFWPAAELLMANQQQWVAHHVSNPEKALAGLKTLPLDHAQLEKDWRSSEISRIVKQDIEDGKTLKVRATPQFFVNGKPLVIFGYEPLVQLIEEAIEEVY